MSVAGSHRHRLVSATYEGDGRACRQQLRDCSLAVYENDSSALRAEEVARIVARVQESRAPCSAFYVMNACDVETRLEEWRKSVGGVVPFYDMRCNSDPLLLQLLTQSRLCNLMVSSLSQLDVALSILPPSRIAFHSPLVTRKTLRILTSLQEPLNSIVLDDEDSIMEMAALAPKQPIMLKVSLTPDSERVDLSMGMLMEDALESVPRMIREGANLAGISLQLLTGERVGTETQIQRAELAVHLLRSLSTLGVSLPLLDIGGGFRRSFLDEAAVILHCVQANSAMPHMELMACPGRFFASSAFSLVTSIVGKHAIDARIITRDEADSGALGFVYETNESCYSALGGGWMPTGDSPQCESLAEIMGGEERHASAVMGCTGDKMDVPQRRALLPSLAVGDWLLWKEMGAYGARVEDGVPVYHFTDRSHWERLQGMEREERWRDDEEDRREEEAEEKNLLSDGGSDVDSEMDDEEDLAECFGRVFSPC